MPSNLLLGNPVQSFNEGQAIGRQNRFNALAGQAVAAPADQRASLIAQAAQADPRQALALNGALSEQDASAEEQRNKALVNMARFYVAAPDAAKPQLRAQLAPSLARFGIDASSASPQDFDKAAQAIVEAWTPANAIPGSLREFNAMTASLSPEDKLKAQRINLGLDPRAVTGAAKTGMITGADGRERPYVFDPSSQSYKIFDGQTFRPLDQSEAAQLGASSSPSSGAPQQPTPEQLMAQATAMANQGGPGANAAKAEAWLQQQLADQGRLPTPASGAAALGVSRSPEETAAATENAKQGVQLAYLPQTEKIKTDAAIQQAAGSAAATNAAKTQAEQAQAFAQRQADARKTLSDLDEVDRLLPQATGGALGKAYDAAAASVNHSTDSSKASAQLDILAGRLTSSVPRMQGPQSDRDVELYQKQAGDLANRNLPIATRQAAAKELRRLQMKYLDNPYGNGSPQPVQSSSPATDNHPPVDDLLSKYGVK